MKHRHNVEFVLWIFAVFFLLWLIGLSIYSYNNRQVRFSGVRYENYKEGMPKKRLTYESGALIKIERYDKEGDLISERTSQKNEISFWEAHKEKVIRIALIFTMLVIIIWGS